MYCRPWATMKSYWDFQWKHIFVAATLQQSQNSLILLQCFCSIFLILQKAKAILKTCCSTWNFFLTFLIEHIGSGPWAKYASYSSSLKHYSPPVCSLTPYMQSFLYFFYSPWKPQGTRGLLMFSGSMKRGNGMN